LNSIPVAFLIFPLSKFLVRDAALADTYSIDGVLRVIAAARAAKAPGELHHPGFGESSRWFTTKVLSYSAVRLL